MLINLYVDEVYPVYFLDKDIKGKEIEVNEGVMQHYKEVTNKYFALQSALSKLYGDKDYGN